MNAPCLPVCVAVCGLSGRGGIPAQQREMRAIYGSFGAANSQQDKEPGTVTPRLAHICPQCGQFSGISKGVGNAEF